MYGSEDEAASTTTKNDIFDEVDENGGKNETWLRIYGIPYTDLAIVDVREDGDGVTTKVELNSVATGLIEPLLELDPEQDAEIIIKGLHTLDSFLNSREYPPRDLTIIIFQILRKGCEGNVDPILITETSQMASKLLRLIPPSTADDRQYWLDVLAESLGVQYEGGKKFESQLREKFIDLFRNFAQSIKSTDVNERKIHGISAFAQALCELLEIDFFFALSTTNEKKIRSLFLDPSNSPHFASLFWPRKMVFVVDRLQLEVVKPIIELLCCSITNFQIREICGRLLGIILEMVRLAEKGESSAEISTSTSSSSFLSRLITDVYYMVEPKDSSRQVCNITSFGWVKRALREIQASADMKHRL